LEVLRPQLMRGPGGKELLEGMHFDEPHVGNDAAAEPPGSSESREIFGREI
jgi:hypothetical protein